MTIEEINKMPMIFIVGMGRSGTTLLRTILDAGEECVFATESKIIIHLKQKYNHKKNWSIELIDEFLTDLYKETKFRVSWGISKEELREKFVSLPMEKITFPLLCKMIYLSYPSFFPKNKIKIIGDKNPTYSIFIPELLEIFPDAKFIHLIRDYRDCILSNKRLFKRQSLFALSQLWKIYNSWITVYSKKFPDRFYFLKYEDLAIEPEKKVREICQFTGLEFNLAMLDYHEKLNEKYDKEANILIPHVHPNLLKKVNTENIGKWKTEFSLEDQKKIAFILDEYGCRYGYDKNPEYKGEKFNLRATYGFFINVKDVFVIKGYFLLPFFIRDSISKAGKYLFKKTGYFTVYNQGDLLHEIVKKQQSEEKIKE